MPKIERKIEIESTPEKIYNIVKDGVNTPRWNLTVSAISIGDEKTKLETDFGAMTIVNVEYDINNGSSDYEFDFKLVRSKTNRKFKEDVFDDFSELFDYVKPEEVIEKVPKTKTLTQIEKLLTKKHGGKKCNEIMKEITYKPEGSLVVVPIDDNRKEVQPTSITDFKDLAN